VSVLAACHNMDRKSHYGDVNLTSSTIFLTKLLIPNTIFSVHPFGYIYCGEREKTNA
jgi:hypothetical protein